MLILLMAGLYIGGLLVKAAIFSVAVFTLPTVFKSKPVRVVTVAALLMIGDMVYWLLAGQLQLSITTANDEVTKFFGSNDLTKDFLAGPGVLEVALYLVISFLAVHFTEKAMERSA